MRSVPADAEVMRKEMADQKVENVFERRRTPTPPPPRLERTPPPSNVSTISFRKDRSQPEVTTEAAREEPIGGRSTARATTSALKKP